MADRLLKFMLVMAVTAFFAIMWGRLLQQHMFLARPTALRPAYEGLLKPGQSERRERWGVYFSGRRIGLSNLTITRDDEGLIHVESATDISISPVVRYLMGVAGDLDIRFEATVSPLSGLRDFLATSERMNTRLLGTVGDDMIRVIGYVAGERVHTELPYSPNVFLGEVFSPMTSLPELSKSDLGRTWSVDMVNPLAGGLQRVTVSVGATREIRLAGERTRVYRLDFATGSNRWESWVGQDGNVIIQGTPFGLTIRRQELPDEVVQQLQAAMLPPPAPPAGP